MCSKRLASCSNVQQGAEAVILKAFGDSLGVNFQSKEISLDRSSVKVDGYCSVGQSIIIAEVYAHQGKAKSAQRNKVYADILKLILIKQELGKKSNVDVYIIFGDEEAASVLKGNSWGAEAARLFGIKYRVMTLDADLKDSIKRTQQNQNLYKAN